MMWDGRDRICDVIEGDVIVKREGTNDDWTVFAEPYIVTFESETESAYTVYVFPDAEMRHQGQPAEVLSTDDPDEVVEYFEHPD